MTRIAFCSAAVTLLAISSAGAADVRMPRKAPAPAPVATGYNWTGCYLGAGGGYGMWNQQNRMVEADTGMPITHDLTAGGRGWFGTVQGGCDYQVNSNIVIGAFADHDFGSIKGTMTTPDLPAQGESKLKRSWAAGGRLGWLPFAQQHLMVFVSAGYTEASFGRVDLFDLNPAPQPQNFYLDRHTARGWFVGTGYEYAIAWFPRLTWKTEYRFADYDRERIPTRLVGNGLALDESLDSHKYVQTVRSALVWRFGSAGAVDRPMPSRAAAPAPVATSYNWTGCYLGAGGGYGMWNQENRMVGAELGEPLSAELTAGGRGWFGTVQVGCDYQVNSNIVIGASADYDFGSIKGAVTTPAFPMQGEAKLERSWAAGGRLGWLPFAQQHLMVFASAGYTEARFGRVDLFDVEIVVPDTSTFYIDASTFQGWFVGTGYEYAIAWVPGLAWKTEYRFADYGRERTPVLFVGGGPPAVSLDSHKYLHTVRSALVWRFNFGGAVVARY
jgi:opacity protein-like surface antigen